MVGRIIAGCAFDADFAETDPGGDCLRVCGLQCCAVISVETGDAPDLHELEYGANEVCAFCVCRNVPHVL